MKVALGSDHGGYDLKENIKKLLVELKIEHTDFGSGSTSSCDYSDYAIKVAEAVAHKEYERGILVCGTGIGMSIAANKVKGIRAALVTDMFTAKATREHNNSNVLCLGGRITGPQIALEIVKIWLGTEFEGGRHIRRLDKITDYENK
ncbi:MAG: ywlF [Haloplasmataceae bacterium]|jgi:ribose 5-phosphate isomerase B|nr:ywlF [Haloplasmataceae bacterium]